jgi:hypothetical protein
MTTTKGEIKIGPIKRGVPLLPRSVALYSEVSRAVHEMKPGDYREIDGQQRQISSSVLTAGKRFGYKIETRKLNGCGIGVWRIK